MPDSMIRPAVPPAEMEAPARWNQDVGALLGSRLAHTRGWLAAHKWLLLRRLAQVSIFALFLGGPLAGVWIVKGNLAASETLGVLPLAEPFAVLQSLAAGQTPYRTVLFGAVTV